MNVDFTDDFVATYRYNLNMGREKSNYTSSEDLSVVYDGSRLQLRDTNLVPEVFLTKFSNTLVGSEVVKGIIKVKDVIYPHCPVTCLELKTYKTVSQTATDDKGSFEFHYLTKGMSYVILAFDKNNQYKSLISEVITL